MRRIVFEAEVFITEKQYKEFQKNKVIAWDVDRPIAQVFNRDIKFKRAYVDTKYRGVA